MKRLWLYASFLAVIAAGISYIVAKDAALSAFLMGVAIYLRMD